MASIETRRNKDATSYRVVWRENGRKQEETFASEADAQNFKKLVEGHGNRWPRGWIRGYGFADSVPSNAPNFSDYAKRAINSRSRANERTRHDYLRDVDRHLNPYFGDKPIDTINREDVGKWLILISKTVAPKTVKNMHDLASSIMRDAVDSGLIDRNVFRGAAATLPTVKTEEMVFLSRGEFDTLLSRIPEPYRPLVKTLAMTGLRWSEATALTVSDVQVLGRKTITVSKAWKRNPDSTMKLGEPKSRRSRRTITIGNDLVDDLIPLIASRPGEDRLFVSPNGRTVLHSNFRYRIWVPAVAAAQRCDAHPDAASACGCPGTVAKTPRIHDLRHSHAAWLIAAGVPLPAIQRRLGHESITTTIDRYGHLMPELDDAISAALDRRPVSALDAGQPAYRGDQI